MKVLYLANPIAGGTGGDRRSFEVLQRVKQHGVDPVVVVDDFVLRKMRAEGNPLLGQVKIYSLKRPNVVYDRYFRSASRAWLDYYSILRTAREVADISRRERVELIVSHHEKTDFLLEAYYAAKKRQIPWTCVFQLPLFPPYASSFWRPVGGSRKLYMYALYSPMYAQVAHALKSAVTLAVSPSIEVETRSYLGGLTIKMHVLRPGVGVDNKKLQKIAPAQERVDAVFFSRLAQRRESTTCPK